MAVNLNFESHNMPGWFIRHSEFMGELAQKGGGVPEDDFAWRLEDRRDGSFALRSVNFPMFCLRHSDFRVHLQGREGDIELFLRDSAFRVVPGLADPEGISFQSVNFPDRFIRHRDLHLWAEPAAGPEDEIFRRDATYYQREAPSRVD